MTVQTGNYGTSSRQVFTPAEDKPVAIFLPQHRKRQGGAALPILTAFAGVAAAFAATAFYMLPDSAGADPQAVSQALADAKETAAGTSAETLEAAEQSEAETAMDAAAVDSVPALTAPSAAASVQEAAATDVAPVQIPTVDDPRWARSTAPSGAAALAAVKALMTDDGSSRSAGKAPGVMAYASPEAGTAPIRQDAGDEQTSSIDPGAGKIRAPADPMPDVEQTRVNSAVNMRTGPGGAVLLVIPAQATVQLYGCTLWCKVGYDGRTGYIYKSFIGGNRSASAPAARNAPTKTAAKKAEEPEKTVSVVSTAEEQEPAKPDSLMLDGANRGR